MIRALRLVGRQSSRWRSGVVPAKRFLVPNLCVRAFSQASAEKLDKKPEVTKIDAVPSEHPSGPAETHTFQAETKRILDIVAKSLYTDTEVFLRELISNASDALSKVRYLQSTNQPVAGSEPLEIRIMGDERHKTLTIVDTGIGMTGQELVENLGTIARSGSKAFAERIKQADASQAVDIIGQFGVGFYSVFMVAEKVEVFSRSGNPNETKAHYWVSDGSGTYQLSAAEGVPRGTKIIIHLKDSCKEFANTVKLEQVIKKYSSFVMYPIIVNDVKLNMVQAIWTRGKDEITEDQYKEFYHYVANAHDDPTYRLHMKTDTPINITALFFFPEDHVEKFGFGRLDPGVNLYSRKVLIQPKSKFMLPEYMRFVKGVVDSEDIPLNISRESLQDSALIQKMSQILTKKVIKFLEQEGKKDPAKYRKWFKNFGAFIKEGVYVDNYNRQSLMKLLRFDSSAVEEPVSFDDYISRMPPYQNQIYYLNSTSREFALASPYYEPYKAEGVEVLFAYQLDSAVLEAVSEYEGRRIVCIDHADATVPKKDPNKADDVPSHDPVQAEELTTLFRNVLGTRLASCRPAKRTTSAPAVILNPDSAVMRKMMRYMNDGSGVGAPGVTKQQLEINVSHPIMQNLLVLSKTKPDVAKLIAEQIFDNALIAVDLLDSPQSMLHRLNSLLTHVH